MEIAGQEDWDGWNIAPEMRRRGYPAERIGMSESKTRNSELIQDFVQYCQNHPDERFWQALRNWSGQNYILATTFHGIDGDFATAYSRFFKDTYSWEGKNG